MFLAAWTTPSGTNSTSPALSVYPRLSVELIFQRALQHIDDLLARMLVPWKGRARREVDTGLEHFAAGDAEIVALEVGARGARRARRRGPSLPTALADDQHGCRQELMVMQVIALPPRQRTDLNAALSSSTKIPAAPTRRNARPWRRGCNG